MTHTSRRATTLALAVLALLAGACTSEDSDTDAAAGDPDTETTSGEDAPLEGSTRGLTEDTIRIGFVGADFGALAEAGLAPDLGDQQLTIPAIVEDINDNGGIGGRQIELSIQIVDGVAGPEAGQAACIELTEEFGAFAVIVAPAVSREVTRCAAVTNETLTLGATGWDSGVYEEADGRLFTLGSHTSMSTDRQYEGWAQMMHDEGELEGRTIGVVTSDGSPEFVAAAENALLPALEQFGYEVAENVVLPCPEGDNDCEQHEAAVQRMKDSGVDFVFMAAANLAGATFVQAAKDLDFAPRWAANGNQVTDTVASFFEGVSDWWDGAVGVSTVFALEEDLSDIASDCNSVVEERAGESYEPGSDAFGFTALNCILFRVLEEGLDAVEGELNQATAIRAIESLSEIPSNAGPPGSLGPDKHDGGDYVFLADYDAAVGEFVQREGEPVRVAG